MLTFEDVKDTYTYKELVKLSQKISAERQTPQEWFDETKVFLGKTYDPYISSPHSVLEGEFWLVFNFNQKVTPVASLEDLLSLLETFNDLVKDRVESLWREHEKSCKRAINRKLTEVQRKEERKEGQLNWGGHRGLSLSQTLENLIGRVKLKQQANAIEKLVRENKPSHFWLRPKKNRFSKSELFDLSVERAEVINPNERLAP